MSMIGSVRKLNVLASLNLMAKSRVNRSLPLAPSSEDE
jgi:hypothetical protein